MNINMLLMNEILDFYSVMIGKSEKIDKLFKKILEELTKEVELQKRLISITSKIDSINNLSSLSNI